MVAPQFKLLEKQLDMKQLQEIFKAVASYPPKRRAIKRMMITAYLNSPEVDTSPLSLPNCQLVADILGTDKRLMKYFFRANSEPSKKSRNFSPSNKASPSRPRPSQSIARLSLTDHFMSLLLIVGKEPPQYCLYFLAPVDCYHQAAGLYARFLGSSHLSFYYWVDAAFHPHFAAFPLGQVYLSSVQFMTVQRLPIVDCNVRCGDEVLGCMHSNIPEQVVEE